MNPGALNDVRRTISRKNLFKTERKFHLATLISQSQPLFFSLLKRVNFRIHQTHVASPPTPHLPTPPFSTTRTTSRRTSPPSSTCLLLSLSNFLLLPLVQLLFCRKRESYRTYSSALTRAHSFARIYTAQRASNEPGRERGENQRRMYIYMHARTRLQHCAAERSICCELYSRQWWIFCTRRRRDESE